MRASHKLLFVGQAFVLCDWFSIGESSDTEGSFDQKPSFMFMQIDDLGGSDTSAFAATYRRLTRITIRPCQ